MTDGRSFPDEAAFQKHLVKFARDRQWLVSHSYRGKVAGGGWRTLTSSNGYPDLTIAGHGQLVVLELKMKPNKPTEAQQAWVDALDAVPGVTARIVYPDDLADIEALLTPDRTGVLP